MLVTFSFLPTFPFPTDTIQNNVGKLRAIRFQPLLYSCHKQTVESIPCLCLLQPPFDGNVLTFGATITEHWRKPLRHVDTPSATRPTILIFWPEFDPIVRPGFPSNPKDQSCRLPPNDYSSPCFPSDVRILGIHQHATPRNAIFPGDSRVRTTIGAGGLFASGEYVRVGYLWAGKHQEEQHTRPE